MTHHRAAGLQHECRRLRVIPNQLFDGEAGSLGRKLQGSCSRLGVGTQDVGAFSGPLALRIDFKFLPALDLGGAPTIRQRLSKSGCRRPDYGDCSQPPPSPEQSNSHTSVSCKNRAVLFILDISGYLFRCIRAMHTLLCPFTLQPSPPKLEELARKRNQMSPNFVSYREFQNTGTRVASLR
nr:hypothetical protein [uncultured Achromobacter sp.]